MTTFDEWLSGPKGQAVQDLLRLWTTLSQDVSVSAAALTMHPLPDFARRQYVRTVVAKVEGFTAKLKGLVLLDASALGDPAEHLLLLEKAPVLDDKGHARTNKQYPRAEPNLRFAMTMYARSNGIVWELPVADHGWAELCSAVGVRNRLMHPKRPDDLDVTDEELESAKAGTEWLDRQYAILQNLIIDKMAYDSGMSAEEIVRFRKFRDESVREALERWRTSA